MAAYRADIEIGVKGVQQLQALTKEINTLSLGVDSINKRLSGASQSINAYNANLNRASQTLNKVNAGTLAEADAIKQYVTALGQANAARDRQNKLIQEQIALQRKIVPTANAGFGMQGPALPSSATRTGGTGGRAGGAISSAIIGGGFPLLFGQGAGAAVGGGFGGLAGGLLGGGFGFALSIAGTAIGDVIDQTQTFNRSLAVLNASTKQYGVTAQITANDVKTLAKNLNITKEEALDVISAFSGFKSADTKNALALLYGTDANTLENLAAVKDQAGLAQVILSSYKQIGIEKATQLINQLKTTDASTVELAFQKALLDVKIKQTEEGLRQITIQDRILAGLASAGSLGAGGPVINPAIFGEQRVQEFRRKNKPADIFTNALRGLQQLRAANLGVEALRPDKAGERAAAKAERDAAREATRVAEVVRNRRASAEFTQIESALQDKIAAAENNKDTVLAARLRGEQALLNVQYEYAKALAEEKDPLAQAAIIYDGLTKTTATRKDTEREINRIYAERQRMVQDMITDLDYEVQLKYATTNEERTRIEIERERSRLIKEGITDENTLAAIAARRAELNKPILGTDLIRQQIGALSDEMTKLIDVGTQVTAIAENIGSFFADSFKGAISGAMTAQEALASFFQSVADRFLDMAAQIIAKWIEMSILNSVLNLFPGGGGAATSALFGAGAPGAVVGGGIFGGAGPFQFRAAGGPVMAGSPYIVGEKGPELFVPGRSGGIVPNDSLGMGSANVVVNVDASGSNVQGDGNQANQLGKVIGIAVQQELIKQKRPGGLLA